MNGHLVAKYDPTNNTHTLTWTGSFHHGYNDGVATIRIPASGFSTDISNYYESAITDGDSK